MTPRIALSDQQKGEIIGMRKCGKSVTEIANLTGFSTFTVYKYIKPRPLPKKRGRKPKLSAMDIRQIIRHASSTGSTCNKIKNDLNLTVGKEAIRKAIHSAGYMVYKKKISKPFMTEKNAKVRLQWCKEKLHCMLSGKK